MGLNYPTIHLNFVIFFIFFFNFSICQIISKTNSFQFEGEWSKKELENLKQKAYIEENSGIVSIDIEVGSFVESSPFVAEFIIQNGHYFTTNKINYIVVGNYVAAKFMNITLLPFEILQQYGIVDITRSTFNQVINSVIINYDDISNRKEEVRKYCYFEGSLEIEKISQDYNKIEQMKGFIDSPNCDIHLHFSKVQPLKKEEYTSKANIYFFLMVSVSVIQSILVIIQLRTLNNSHAFRRISITSLTLAIIIDNYISFFHLIIGLVYEEIFSSLIYIAFLQFMIFSTYEMRYLLLVYKAQNNREIEDMRSEMTSLYFKIYFATFGGVILVYNFPVFFKKIQIILVQLDILLEQVLQNYTLQYISFFIKGNFLRVKPDQRFTIYLIIFVISLLIIILSQKKNPRYFIPKKFLPEKYNYFRPINLERLKEDVCVICLDEIKENDYMITPCNHIFHRSCLEKWMEIKIECPTCRATIPPP
ncbi:dsc e3 ubiquitin ligase complex subunit 1 [Anaeramoeba ignava]|uniref:RING-type E3 ubiquitin transferase n=1 Tax=Anaeramoeba ignava TaxID=1746090 RepID=A0A9Q0LJ11_ANAIG|nr:dsc e3 ubiquitin ligase complex subunit 1 [Anaeramoeba ignava]